MESIGETTDGPPNAAPSSSRRRRHFKACLRCRGRKVRCPGGQPCANCSRTEQECHYDSAKKLFVSEAYLRRLERGVPSPGNGDSGRQFGRSRSLSAGPNEINDDHVSNPLATETIHSTTDRIGGSHFVGHSSTWGFAWRVRRLLKTLPSASNNRDLTTLDDSTHSPIDLSSMLSPEDALALPEETKERYLSNYMYHIAPVWFFLDPIAIKRDLHSPQTTRHKDIVTLLRDIQLNLVMALGKLLEYTVNKERSPGETYLRFARNTMNTMDESKAIAIAPILFAQNLCLISFYLHAVNMRNDSYIQIGKAMRIAFTQGLHRISSSLLPGDGDLQETHVRFWWSLYSLDMLLTSLMGGPVSAHENEITTREPTTHSVYGESEAVTYCVKVARIMAMVLSEVYGAKSSDRSIFVQSIRKVLQTTDRAIETMPTKHKLDFEADTWHVSRTSATLYLMTYQTLIVAIRPVLYHLVKLKVEQLSSSRASLPVPSLDIRQLLKRMVDAAVKSIRILTSVMYQGQLQAFLAFDVTAAFSSAVILSLAAFSSSKPVAEVSHIGEANRILNALSIIGNASAQKRLDDLEDLQKDLSSAESTFANKHAEDLAAPRQTAMAAENILPHTMSFINSAGVAGVDEIAIPELWDLSWDTSLLQIPEDEATAEGYESFFSHVDQYSDIICTGYDF